MGVHPGALHAVEGLRHEGGHNLVPGRDFLDDHTHGHDRIGHGQGVGVPQVDLVLARRVLMLAVFDRDTHVFESEDGLATQVGAEIIGGQVEVGPASNGTGVAPSVVPGGWAK